MNITTNETETEIKNAELHEQETTPAEIIDADTEVSDVENTEPFVELQKTDMFSRRAMFRFRQKLARRMENPKWRAIMGAREMANRAFNELMAMTPERRSAILLHGQCILMFNEFDRRRKESQTENTRLRIDWGKFAYAF